MKNVLFVCIGNSCRSQIAEGFARAYGADVMRAWSAGLSPAGIVQPLTIDVMEEKHIDIRDQFPKSINELDLNAFDLIANMSGVPITAKVRGETRYWAVDDPIGQPKAVYVRIRDQIEGLVMQLIMDLRRGSSAQMVAAPVRLRNRVRPRDVPAVLTASDLPGAREAAADAAKQGTSESSKLYSFGRLRRKRD